MRDDNPEPHSKEPLHTNSPDRSKPPDAPPSAPEALLQEESSDETDEENSAATPPVHPRVDIRVLQRVRSAVFVPTVLILAVLAVVCGFAGFWLLPDSQTPGRPATTLFQIYVPQKHRVDATLSARVLMTRGGLGPEGTVEVAFSLDTPPLGNDLDWYVVADLVPGSRLVSASGLAPADPQLCAQQGCAPKPNDLDRMVFKPQCESVGKTVNVVYEWANESALIPSEGSKIAFYVPGAVAVRPESAKGDPLDTKPLQYGLSVASAFGKVGDYSIDAGPQPAAEFGDYWIWTSSEPFGSSGISIASAHSIADQNTEHSNEFLSGILLGLAGAAAIVFAQELLNRLFDADK